jgi:hypothetical protein
MVVDVHPLVSVVNAYRDKQYIEIEMRLGVFKDGRFDTDIGKATFDTLKRRLSRYTQWESVNETADDVYYWDDIRSVYSPDGNVTTCKKHKIMKKDIRVSPMDIRFAVSQEVPATQPSEDAKRHVCRKRTSYVRKNLSIDITEVISDPVDIDSEEETTYQCELEIINVSNFKNDAEIENLLYKINDVLAIV